MQDLFERFTLDTSGEFLFGSKDLNTLDLPLALPRDKSGFTDYAEYMRLGSRTTSFNPAETSGGEVYQGFVRGFQQAQRNVNRRRASGYGWLFTEFFDDSQAGVMRGIEAWIDPLAERALEKERKRREAGTSLTDDSPDMTCFLDHLAASTDDVKLVKDQLLNVLLAARDTTAALLTFATYMMAMYPEATVKLRNEILEKCGKVESPTFEMMKELKYCMSGPRFLAGMN